MSAVGDARKRLAAAPDAGTDGLAERVAALADDLSQYNPGFGDYVRAAHLIRAVLDHPLDEGPA